MPHIPTPLEQLGGRPFSFYPAIVNIEHNEWLLQRAGGDEIEVLNTKTKSELWIPRRFLSGVSSIEEPVVIVGLVKELEYKEGVVVPHVQRVIEMPRAVNDVPWRSAAPVEPGYRAPVVGIKVESEPDARKGRPLLVKIAAGLLTCVVGMIAFRDGSYWARSRFFTPMNRVSLPFTASDDYFSVVSRLGRPASERWRPAPGGGEFQLLRYPDRGFIVVLVGPNHDAARYAGALGRGGRVLHSVKLPTGEDSTPLLDFLHP